MTMGSHQTPLGKENARFTPRWIFEPLGEFHTDAAAGDPRPWNIGTQRNITRAENCLTMDWRDFGRTWLNPPFMRYGVGEFVRLMCAHNYGTMLLHVRTETTWFKPIQDIASAVLFLAGRVIFCNADGSPCRIENPEAKHYGKKANSGAPVVLVAFGKIDAESLDSCGLGGWFIPLNVQRYMLIAALDMDEEGKSWRQIVVDWLKYESEPVTVAQLYRAFSAHPKSKANPNWKAKLRQTLQRGAARSLGRDQWVAA